MNKHDLITEIINDGTMDYLLTFSGGEILKELIRLQKDDNYNDFTMFLNIMNDFLTKENEAIAKLEAGLQNAKTTEELEEIDMDIHYLSSFRNMAIKTIEKVNNYLLLNHVNKVTI